MLALPNTSRQWPRLKINWQWRSWLEISAVFKIIKTIISRKAAISWPACGLLRFCDAQKCPESLTVHLCPQRRQVNRPSLSRGRVNHVNTYTLTNWKPVLETLIFPSFVSFPFSNCRLTIYTHTYIHIYIINIVYLNSSPHNGQS